jgi:hypothetical protein
MLINADIADIADIGNYIANISAEQSETIHGTRIKDAF